MVGQVPFTKEMKEERAERKTEREGGAKTAM